MSSKFTNSQPTIEVKVNSPTANLGITDAEYNISLNPDVEADIFATKTELSAVENKIPAEYVKSAAVADNKLTLTKQDNTVVEFEGGGSSYTLPVASTTTLGGVKPDGTTTTVDEDGTIHAHDTTPVATTTTVGSVKPDGTTITIDSNGVINANIPTKISDLTNDSDFITTEYHDSTKQNVLIPGDNITISGNVISSTGGGGGGSYTLPVASTYALGGVMVGGMGFGKPSGGGRYVFAENDGRLYVPLPDTGNGRPGVVYPGSGLKLSGDIVILDTPSKGANGKYSIGGVKPDETTTTVDKDGTIHAHYTLPVASTTTLGGVKVDDDIIRINNNGTLYVDKTKISAPNGLPSGGWYPQILMKNGSHNYDTTWSNISNVLSMAGISIGGGGGEWQNTTDISNSDLYNAKEVVIFWTDNQSNYHQTYLNVGCDYYGNSGSTWGSSNWLNTNIWLDKLDEYNGAYISYNGSYVEAYNCAIPAICYKT